MIKPKNEPTITVTLTLEQASTIRFALGAGRRRCREQFPMCKAIDDRYALDQLIAKYDEIDGIIKKKEFEYIERILKEKGMR